MVEPSSAKSAVEEELTRTVRASSDVLGRLRQGARVSEVLSDVSLIASIRGDEWIEDLVCLLTYGLERHRAMRAAGLVRRPSARAFETWFALAAVADVKAVDFEEIAERGIRFEDTVRTNIVSASVRTLEEADIEDSRRKPISELDANESEWSMWNRLFQTERKGVLYRIRSYLADYVHDIWLESVRELERIRLLGVDYRAVVADLNNLPGDLGDQLLAAGDNLRSTNPHNWQLCRLGCRNVVLALGRELWPTCHGQYTLRNGNILEVGPNMEKNGLRAYLDSRAREADATKRIVQLTEQADKLATKVYKGGSAGKGAEGEYEKSRELLLQTYTLVRVLAQIGALGL